MESSIRRPGIPYVLRSSELIGRDDVLAQVLELLKESKKPIILASGQAGIGKSKLASEVTWHFYHKRGPFQQIVWVDLRQYTEDQRITFEYVLNEIANGVNGGEALANYANKDMKVNSLRRLIESRSSLLVFDNYESVLQDPAEEAKITGFVQALATGNCDELHEPFVRVLITTRWLPESLRPGLSVEDVRLRGLSTNDAVSLLKSLVAKELVEPGQRLANSKDDATQWRLESISDDQWGQVASEMWGLPQYLINAVQALRVLPFDEWLRDVRRFKQNPDYRTDERARLNHLFNAQFQLIWERVLANEEDVRRILLAMTFFIGGASFESLREASGVAPSRFASAIRIAGDGYLELGRDDRYGMHPLPHAYCLARLNDESNKQISYELANRFIEYFFARISQDSPNLTEFLSAEHRNVTAAIQLAKHYRQWGRVLELHARAADPLQRYGHWLDLEESCHLAVEASIELNDRETHARLVGHTLAWLNLRFERVEAADQYAADGEKEFRALHDPAGEAQAIRHRGKAALLKGEHELAQYSEKSWIEHFRDSEQFYEKSKKIREQLVAAGSDQRVELAFLLLDFGRLYWLVGRKHAREASAKRDGDELRRALSNYEESIRISEQARLLFEEVALERANDDRDLFIVKWGIAKAHGNLGNTYKERARLEDLDWLAQNDENIDRAIAFMNDAFNEYEINWKIGDALGKTDEISHSLWGMAEIHEFLSDHVGKNVVKLHDSFLDSKEKVLERALEEAEEAHRLYDCLGGGRDIEVTAELVDRIQKKLAARIQATPEWTVAHDANSVNHSVSELPHGASCDVNRREYLEVQRDAVAHDESAADSLPPSRRKAHDEFFATVKENPKIETDEEAYEAIKEKLWMEDEESLKQLPKFETWRRYLSEARRYYGTTRYNKRLPPGELPASTIHYEDKEHSDDE